MNLLWNLAKKNLFCSRARTIVSVIAIAIAIIVNGEGHFLFTHKNNIFLI